MGFERCEYEIKNRRKGIFKIWRVFLLYFLEWIEVWV